MKNVKYFQVIFSILDGLVSVPGAIIEDSSFVLTKKHKLWKT
jgi:hypothetical protein